MSANKKRRRQPEEDLEAAVADIINSPITRSNLSFLRPLENRPEPMGVESIPPGVDPNTTAFSLYAMGFGLNPMGLEPKPMGLEVPAQDGICPSAEGTSIPPVSNNSELPHVQRRSLWQAEGLGSIFEQSRVRRITKAQDALSLVEEKVYDLLWGPKNQRKDEFRLVHYSLQRIASEARINIKTVRELIPRLIEKGFANIEHEADVRRNIPTLYRVSSYSTILADQKRRNRLYVAKSGKGVFYVHLVSASLHPSPYALDSEPMGLNQAGVEAQPLGVDSNPTSLAPIPPMGASGPKPMGASGTPSIDNFIGSNFRQTSSSTVAQLVSMIQNTLGVMPDHQLLGGIIELCHRNSVEATGQPASDEELLYFTSAKAATLARATNIRNHLAVLRKAVPECFLGETFRAYRAATESRKQRAAEEAVRQGREAEQQIALMEETEARYAAWTAVSERHKVAQGYDMQAIAEDPDLDERGRQQARKIIQRVGRFTRTAL